MVFTCNQSDLLFIGTPAEFRKPHGMIMDLIGGLRGNAKFLTVVS
jgi:hypothetical protein